MPTITFRKRQCFSDIPRQALTERVVPALLMGGFTGLFAHTAVRFCGEDRLIGLPKVTVPGTPPKRGWNPMPQAPTRPGTAITDDKGQNMFRPTQQDRPEPPCVHAFPHETPGVIHFQHVVGLCLRERLLQRGQVLEFFLDPGGQCLPGDSKNSADAPHTRTFLIRPQNFFTAFLAVPRRFGRQDANRPAIFTPILLTPASIMAVFDNIRTAACAALMLNRRRNHSSRIQDHRVLCKKIIHHLTGSHYRNLLMIFAERGIVLKVMRMIDDVFTSFVGLKKTLKY